jgi:hypothetical protein
LPLLVTRVAANDVYHAAAADHLALITNTLNAGSYFHGNTPDDSFSAVVDSTETRPQGKKRTELAVNA